MILTGILLTAGCTNQAETRPESLPETETMSANDESAAEGSVCQKDQEAEYKEYLDDDFESKLDDYMVSVKEQADGMQYALEHDALTQIEMNRKSQELYGLWDEALSYLWGELERCLPEAEFTELQDSQKNWIAEKEDAIQKAGEEFKGGSMYALIVSSEAAKVTEERVYQLYALLKQAT